MMLCLLGQIEPKKIKGTKILKSLVHIDGLTIINAMEISHISIVDPNLNSRPEYVAGVNDSTSRRWGTIEVSVPNLWKDNVGQNKDEAPR